MLFLKSLKKRIRLSDIDTSHRSRALCDEVTREALTQTVLAAVTSVAVVERASP
jgi:hypothetical protein